jgi:DNA polymerase III alpha subunit
MLDLKTRILKSDGTSIVWDSKAMEFLLTTGNIPDHIKVVDSEDARKYKRKYRQDIIADDFEPDIKPDISYDEDDFAEVVVFLENNKRDDTSDEEHEQRLMEELDYFIRSGHQHFVIKINNLIKQFRRDNVVWGVGRGSSCSSYVMFLLGVHDVNPIKYEIDFSEFSKE